MKIHTRFLSRSKRQYPRITVRHLGVLVLVACVSLHAPLNAQDQGTEASPSGETGSVNEQSLDGLNRENGNGRGTKIPVDTSLTSLYENGGVPKTIEQLRDLEEQQRRVAAAVVDCTVSVKIGPAQGCGVIITESGYVLTAAHVAMRPGKTAEVLLSDGRSVVATTLGMNRNVDAGLMKIKPNQNNGSPWPHATLGSSDDLVPGMWCIATGHPGGYDLQRGPVTRVGRILAVRPNALVTDCALIGGDSGGPLFDISGKLIAVHSRIGNDVADNLHVPITLYETSWEKMQQSVAWGFLPGFRPVLGVTGSKSSELATIDFVKAGSPADAAGLIPGDVVEEFGDRNITNFESLKSAVAETMPGERVRMLIFREGRKLVVNIEIGRAD